MEGAEKTNTNDLKKVIEFSDGNTYHYKYGYRIWNIF